MKILVAASALIPLCLVQTGSPGANTQPPPILRTVPVSGYQIAIRGSGWLSRGRVAFAVKQGTDVTGLELRTTKAGSFVVGVNTINLCGGSTFKSRDLQGRSAKVLGPALECPSPRNPPTPTLTVVKGAALTIGLKHVDGLGHGPVTIRQGNGIYLWESGTTKPSLDPSAPHRYFGVIGRGQTPARMCPQTECASGFYWKWVGLKAGSTGIVLSPACRRSTPPCEMADVVMAVTINPLNGSERTRDFPR